MLLYLCYYIYVIIFMLLYLCYYIYVIIFMLLYLCYQIYYGINLRAIIYIFTFKSNMILSKGYFVQYFLQIS